MVSLADRPTLKSSMEQRMSDDGYQLGKWDLGDLYPGIDSEETEQALKEVESQVAAFEDERERLDDDIPVGAFREILDRYERLNRLFGRLGGYASLRFAEDTQDQRAQSFQAKIRQLVAEADNRTLFFKLWWKTLDEEVVERLLAASGDYRYWLEALRLQSPHTLSEPEEKIINLKDVNGPQALVTLYQSITNRYTFELEIDGEIQELTQGELRRYVRGPDAALRAAAYQEMFRVYGEDAPILGQLYQFVTRDWFSEHVRLRGYESPIAVRNLANDLPGEVVETLLAVCQENAPIFRRFFRLKAAFLNMDKLRRYDLYAPVAESEQDYSYAEAIELVLDSFREFEPQVADLAGQVLAEDHMDSEVRKGKRSGAFCATLTPDITPYVLTSFQGKARDVATLAHELGHAVHSQLAADHTALTQRACLPLAETASTFGEMLLVDRMLAQDPDPAIQRDLLLRQLDDSYGTILRQAYFALFERSAHDAIQEGAAVDDLSAIYAENLEKQFGDSVEISEEFHQEWVVVPHFYHSPFYVYAYAFGKLLVLSLYQRYQEEGDAFKPAYLDILRAGGAAAPLEILDSAGLDVRRPAFWQAGFHRLAAILEQLEELRPEVRV